MSWRWVASLARLLNNSNTQTNRFNDHLPGKPGLAGLTVILISADQYPEHSRRTSQRSAYSTLALVLPTVYHTVCSGITCQQPTGAVMRDKKNDRVGHATDCRPAWNKCRWNHCLECISSFNTRLSHFRPCFNIHSDTILSNHPWTSHRVNFSHSPSTHTTSRVHRSSPVGLNLSL